MRRSLILLLACAVVLVGCRERTETSTAPKESITVAVASATEAKTMVKKVEKSDAEWRGELSSDAYQVLRKSGTEAPFSGQYWNTFDAGTYVCAACGNSLFASDAKFSSSCGWPSFFEALHEDSLVYVEDRAHGMVRTEIRCGKCGGHLGHVFDDGPPPTGKRYCLNSVAMQLVDEPAAE